MYHSSLRTKNLIAFGLVIFMGSISPIAQGFMPWPLPGTWPDRDSRIERDYRPGDRGQPEETRSRQKPSQNRNSTGSFLFRWLEFIPWYGSNYFVPPEIHPLPAAIKKKPLRKPPRMHRRDW